MEGTSLIGLGPSTGSVVFNTLKRHRLAVSIRERNEIDLGICKRYHLGNFAKPVENLTVFEAWAAKSNGTHAAMMRTVLVVEKEKQRSQKRIVLPFARRLSL